MRTAPAQAARPAGRARRAGRWRRHVAGYAFLAPWLIGFFCFTLGPAIASLALSFTNYNLLQPPHFVGLANYAYMAASGTRFASALRVTFVYVALSVPLKLAFALALALLFNRETAGTTIYRAIFYLPSLLGTSVAIGVLWRQLFAADGLVNGLLAQLGIAGPSWISDPRTSLLTLVLLSVWQFGSPMIIFLAGLRQVPRDLYEAASLDGAGTGRRFWHVTLPMLTPVIFFNAVIQTIEAFKAFTPAFVISAGTGGPIDSTLFYTLYLYQEAFQFFHMGYASALAWVLVLIIGAMTALSFFFSRYWVHYDA